MYGKRHGSSYHSKKGVRSSQKMGTNQVNIAISRGQEFQQPQQQSVDLQQQALVANMLDPSKFAELTALGPDNVPFLSEQLLDRLDEEQLKMLLAHQQMLLQEGGQD